MIQNTSFLLPGYVVSNGQITGNAWQNPNNILLVDGLLTESNPSAGSASDIIIGGFNANLPQNAVITGIEMELIAKIGSQTIPPLALTIEALDNTSGSDIFYPYTAPFTGITPTLATYTLGTSTYLFGTSFTVDQINNLKFALLANGDIYVDSFLMKVFYFISVTPTPPGPVQTGCVSCNSPLEVPPMFLQLPFLSGETVFYLKPGSMTYANGQPIVPSDLSACSVGEICFTFDEGQTKGNADNNFQEDVALDITTGFWQILPSGVVEVSLGSVNDRGLLPYQPYTHSASFMSDHDANTKVIISNSGKFYSRFVRTCQVGLIFSAPIDVMQNGSNVVNPATKLNFKGAGVTVVNSGSGQADITISGFTNTPPSVANSLDFVTNSSVSTYSTPSFDVTGTDRLLMVAFTINSGVAPTLTWNGGGLTSVTSSTISGFTCWIFYIIAPDLGSHTLDFSFNAPTPIAGNVVLYNQVNQSSPLGTHVAGGGTGVIASIAVTTATTNAIVFHAVSTKHFPILYTPDVGESLVASSVSGTLQSGVENQSVGTPATVTTLLNLSVNTDWSDIAVPINGLATPVIGVQSVTGALVNNTDPANPIINAVLFETDGAANSDQTELNLISGSNISLTPGADGAVTIDATGIPVAVIFETNGSANSDQTELNLIAGTNITLTAGADGAVTIDASAIGGGAWTKISTQTINTTVATGTLGTIAQWSTLTGDTDDEYMILFEASSDVDANGSFWAMTLNNDTTALHYTYAYIARTINGTTQTGNSTGNNIIAMVISDGGTNIGSTLVSGTSYVKASKTIAGLARRTYGQLYTSANAAGAGGEVSFGGEWTDTTNQVTSLELKYNNANVGLATIVGKATLYKINR